MKKFMGLILLLLLMNVSSLKADQEVIEGITEPINDSTLGVSVAGPVSLIKIKEGEFVKKNDVILELENKEEALEVQRRKIIFEDKSELKSAQVKVETLKFDYEGTLALYETTQSVSKEELQKKEFEYKVSQAELEKAISNEKKEEIEYQMAQEELNKRYIKAPFDGLVVKIVPHIGETCGLQQEVVRVVDTRKCRFIAYLEAKQASSFKKGMKVNIKVEDPLEPIMCEGIVEYVCPVVDAASSLQEVKVIFDNPNGLVRPGLNAVMNEENKNGK